ncbi:hypothetical protein QQF64_008297, partial [Cirrhinus molitorella]
MCFMDGQSNPANRCSPGDVIEMKGNSASNTRSRSDHTRPSCCFQSMPASGSCSETFLVFIWSLCICKYSDEHIEEYYRHQTAGFHLSFYFRAGLGTSSDLSGEHTGSHPERLPVGDGSLTSDSLSCMWERLFTMPQALILSGFPLQRILVLPLCVMFAVMAEERRDCREQEYKDKFGNCIPCRQCDAGQELSKECGFGYGEDAQCVPCRASRFKEDRSLQKCKPCLDCSLLNRFQKGNCSTTNNAVCGDCLLGFYRKTKLSGFQDMECIPCGDPPPPYEPHCIGRVNFVPVQPAVTSPRDMALAAVICSALATVLLALFILCVIYCKRQLLEKKPE